MSLRDFKRIKKDVDKYIGHDETTTDSELLRAGKYFIGKLFKGVFPRDKLPKLKNGESLIFNTDTSAERGTHWLALYCHGNNYIIYDSFGRNLNTILPKLFLSGCGKKILTPDDDAEQETYETDCGQNSLSWLIFVYQYSIDAGLKI